MTENETWTIKKILDWTTEYFKKYNIEWPHLEAEILLAHTLGVPRIQLYVQFERVLASPELAEYKNLILKRSKHEPIAYITGKQPFMSLEIEVNPSVLIPRPETEKLVEVTIDAGKNIENPVIADLGTGSGAIAVSLAKYLPKAKIYATDSSKEAIEVAKINAEKHGVQDQCTFFVGNLLEPLNDIKGKLGIIVSNPPYIPSEEINSLQQEIKNYEPRYALDGGKDGLNFLKKIIQEAHPFFSSAGAYLILEVGKGQAQAIVQIIELDQKYKDIKVIKDYSGIDRVIIMQPHAIQ